MVLSLALFVPCVSWSALDSAWAWLILDDDQAAPAWRAAASGRIDEARSLLSQLPSTPSTRRLERILVEQSAVPVPHVRFEASSASVAFRAARNGTPIVEVSLNGARFEMGLDTGAGFSVITQSVARKVNARPLEGIAPKVEDSLGQSVNAALFVVDLVIGGMEARNLPVLVVEDARLRASVLGVTLFSFEGLVGWNALSQSRLVVDFEAKKLSLGPPLRDCPARNLFSLGFKPLVEIRLNERPMLALVDLGARTSFALSGAPELAGGTPETQIIAGASGSTVQPVSVLRDVSVELPGRKTSLAKLSVRERGAVDALNSVTVGLDVIGAGTLILDFPCGEFRSTR